MMTDTVFHVILPKMRRKKFYQIILMFLLVFITLFACTNKKTPAEDAFLASAVIDEDPVNSGYTWNFDNPSEGTAGWKVVPDEFWAYSGTAQLSRDDTVFGKGMLRFDVDFTADSGKDWSEPKIKFIFKEPVDMGGLVNFSFDFYYNPNFSTGGHFKSKIIALNGNSTLVDSVSGAISGRDETGEYLKAPVTLSIRNTKGKMDSMLLSIAGYLTDYKGSVFFDNLRWESRNYVPPVAKFVFNMPNLPPPDPLPNKIRLFNYLTDIYGKYILSGQMDTSWTMNDKMDMIARVFTDTGKYPAIKGFDLIQLSDNNAPFFGGRQQIDEAIEWWEGKNNGISLLPGKQDVRGIVTFCWHWRTGSTDDFYSDKTAFRIPWKDGKLDAESENFKTIVDDLDKVALRLTALKEKDIPVLWRPLHEASGGWFWWGASGPAPYIALWEFMHEYLTNAKQLNNLIWVWNGENAAWFPDPKTIDIVGSDLYSSSHSSQKRSFENTLAMVPLRDRMAALSENGKIPDPDECIKDKAMWLWFMTWNDRYNSFQGENHKENFWTGELVNNQEHKMKVYHHTAVITLDELPDITTYRLK
ncbi:MAG: glycoside hydrolase family 26 protein [Treponema sp.]|nr:glycoside hydrolase family 26 protein [Treponema sp.]MCL2272550.1 glycoside hydrolase family 26 protein [Treponema sp.]